MRKRQALAPPVMSKPSPAMVITAARGVTLKVYRALSDADPARAERLGRGQCDIYSRSRTLGAATRDAAVLFRVLRTLSGRHGLPAWAASRGGPGISQLTKLERSAAGAAGSAGAGGNRGLLRFVKSGASPKKADGSSSNWYS